MRLTRVILSVVALATVSASCTTNTTSPKPSASATIVAREMEARDRVNSILFDQQTHFIGNKTFTTSLKDLETMKTSLESPSYRFAIKPKPNQQTGVWVTATPKLPNLRSFTGVVFAINSGKERLTVSEVCETIQPSKKAPVAPAKPRTAREVIKCPAGSNSSSDMLALQ